MNATGEAAQPTQSDGLIPLAGTGALISAVISAIGVVLFFMMYALFVAQNMAMAFGVGWVNDLCVAIQYALTIPIALALHRILAPHNPAYMRFATPFGIVAMVAVVLLQLTLVFDVLTFEQEVLPVSLAMIVGVGTWLVITGLVARATDRLPHSLALSLAAIPYFGYPVWAFWIGRHLRNW